MLKVAGKVCVREGFIEKSGHCIIPDFLTLAFPFWSQLSFSGVIRYLKKAHEK